MELVRALSFDPVPREKRHHFAEREGHSFQAKDIGSYNASTKEDWHLPSWIGNLTLRNSGRSFKYNTQV